MVVTYLGHSAKIEIELLYTIKTISNLYLSIKWLLDITIIRILPKPETIEKNTLLYMNKAKIYTYTRTNIMFLVQLLNELHQQNT